MDKGKKRPIVGGRPGSVYKTLKVALGFKEDDDDYEMNIVKAVPTDILTQIDNGPSFDKEDIGGGLPVRPKSIAVRLDPSDYRANPDLYNSVKEYKIALEKEITQAWDLERNMENLVNKYNNDLKTLQEGPERDQSKQFRKEAGEELEDARRKLAAYKIIYQKIESDESVKIEGLEELYNRLAKDDFDEIPDVLLNQFKGWEKGKGDLEDIVGTYYKGSKKRNVRFS
jgi:hypothetical protein